MLTRVGLALASLLIPALVWAAAPSLPPSSLPTPAPLMVAAAEPVDRLAALGKQEQALTLAYGRNRAALARLLSVLVMFRRDPPPPLLVSPTDARDAVRAAILVRAITPELQRRARVLTAQGSAIAALRREAAAQGADRLIDESQQADRSGGSGASALGLRPLVDAISDGADSPSGSLTLTPPLAGAVIRRFGDTLSGGGKARGVTIRAQSGANVQSPATGAVEFAGEVNGWGVVLILRSAGAYHLVLAGLDESSAHAGDVVAAGEKIGRLPAKGTPELYMEVRDGDVLADPARWLPIARRRQAGTRTNEIQKAR